MTQVLSIRFFSHSWISDWNHGNAHFLRGLARELVRLGHHVRCYEEVGSWSLTNLIQEGDVASRAIDTFHSTYPELDVRFYTRDASLPAFLNRELADADLVIIHEWSEPDVVNEILARKKRLGFRALFHDTHHRAYSNAGQILRFHLHLSTAMFLRAGAVVVLMLGGALMEELAFRGYPFQKLTESLGALGAVLVLSALFGAVHLQNPESSGWLSWGFFNTIAVGIIFALVRIRTASLLFPFGLHFGWNFFQGAVFGLPVSGLEEFSTVVRATVHGAPALTGGTYGPEASATCALVLVIALPITWVFTSKQKIQHRPPLHRSAAGI